MNLTALLRWRTTSPGFHTLRTGVLALLGALFLARLAVLVVNAIWPHGEPAAAFYGLDLPVFVLIFFLVLVGLISIPFGIVVLIKERFRRGD